jgi:NTE family protein
MQKKWGVTARLCDLPEQPRWMINATCYETGKNWRFERFRMGDYLFGYSNDTDLPLTDAMAASAGFPGLIGPIVLDTTKQRWFQYIEKNSDVEAVEQPSSTGRKTQSIEPTYPRVHLWDGGVYDNHGLEGLIDVRKGWRRQVEFLIVSDGAGRSGPEKYKRGHKALLRIVSGIMMDQIRSLRARIVLERLINHGEDNKGSFLQIGNSGVQILTDAGLQAELPEKEKGFQKPEEAVKAATFPTVIRMLTGEEFELLFRHGYEVANCTLYAYNRDQFAYIGYQDRTASTV